MVLVFGKAFECLFSQHLKYRKRSKQAGTTRLINISHMTLSSNRQSSQRSVVQSLVVSTVCRPIDSRLNGVSSNRQSPPQRCVVQPPVVSTVCHPTASRLNGVSSDRQSPQRRVVQPTAASTHRPKGCRLNAVSSNRVEGRTLDWSNRRRVNSWQDRFSTDRWSNACGLRTARAAMHDVGYQCYWPILVGAIGSALDQAHRSAWCTDSTIWF